MQTGRLRRSFTFVIVLVPSPSASAKRTGRWRAALLTRQAVFIYTQQVRGNDPERRRPSAVGTRNPLPTSVAPVAEASASDAGKVELGPPVDSDLGGEARPRG